MITRQLKHSIINRICQTIKRPYSSSVYIETVEDISNALNSLSTYTKELETSIFSKGCELGIENTKRDIAEKMAKNNMTDADIRKITGLSLAKIDQIRKKIKK